MIVVKAWGLPKSLYGIIERMDGLGSYGNPIIRFRLLTAWEAFDLEIEFVPEINRFRRGIRLKKS